MSITIIQGAELSETTKGGLSNKDQHEASEQKSKVGLLKNI
jgi:hypothetical protein